MQRWADSAKVALPRHSRQRARLVSQVGGIPTAEMNSLELEFLFMINFTLNVTPEVYRYLRPIALRTPRAILATDAAAAGARRQYEHELMMRKFLQAQCSCRWLSIARARASVQADGTRCCWTDFRAAEAQPTPTGFGDGAPREDEAVAEAEVVPAPMQQQSVPIDAPAVGQSTAACAEGAGAAEDGAPMLVDD